MSYYKNGIKLLFASLLLVTIACSSSGSVKNPEDMTLADHLDQIDGVRVTGSGDYTKVRIRPRKVSRMSQGQGWGGKSNSNSRGTFPVYIVNGQKIGQDYIMIRDMLKGREIKSAKLLSENASYRFGVQSGFRGIEIITKAADSLDKEGVVN